MNNKNKRLILYPVLVIIGIGIYVLFVPEKEITEKKGNNGENSMLSPIIKEKLFSAAPTTDPNIEEITFNDFVQGDQEIKDTQSEQDIISDFVFDPVFDPETKQEIEEEIKYEASIDSYGRPYLYTVPESEFMKMSPEDQEKIIDEIVEDATTARGHVINCLQEASQLRDQGNYSAAEIRLVEGMKIATSVDGGDHSLVLGQIISITLQTDLTHMMKGIYDRTRDTEASLMAQNNIIALNERRTMLEERQNKSYGMYWERK